MTGSNYPPGVTGNEPEIAGYPACAECGHEAEGHDPEDGHCEEEDCGCLHYERYADPL